MIDIGMLIVAFLLTSDTASGTGISVIKYLGALNNHVAPIAIKKYDMYHAVQLGRINLTAKIIIIKLLKIAMRLGNQSPNRFVLLDE